MSQAEIGIAANIFAGGGEMGALMRTIDWSATPIGPIETWSPSLRTSISICLASRFPILIWWGADLVMLYNDAYRPILGAKHPQAMGQPGRECWPEIWQIIGPMLEGVLATGQATWSDDQLLLPDRNGYIEECYFTFSYSPILDETGNVGGVFTAVTETTERVISERRLATLHELAAKTAEAKTAQAACQISATTLAANKADIPFALLYTLDKGRKQAQLQGLAGLTHGTPISPQVVDLAETEDASTWPFAKVVQTGQIQQVDNLTTRFGLKVDSIANLSRALVLPIAQANQESLVGILVLGINPQRSLDEKYRDFFQLVAGQIATAIANARAYEEERQRSEALAEVDRAKTLFFSNISHEFRTPLTLMLAPLEEMLASLLPPKGREQLEIVHRNSLRLLKLVNT